MSNTELLELAERCEKATGPESRLDAEIEAFLQRPTYPDAKAVRLNRTNWAAAALATPPSRGNYGWRRYGLLFQQLRYTASIDAAMQLVPESLLWSVDAYPDHAEALVRAPYYDGDEIRAATPALALCAAALKARASQ